MSERDDLEPIIGQAAAVLADRLRELLAPSDAVIVTLTRDEAVLAMGILEGVALHIDGGTGAGTSKAGSD